MEATAMGQIAEPEASRGHRSSPQKVTMRYYSHTGLLSVTVLLCALSLISAGKYYSDSPNPNDPIVAELGPHLSPEASIILPTDNAIRFAELTTRWSSLFQPDITAIIRVGIGADVPEIIKYSKKKGRPIFTGSARHGWATTLNDVHDAIMIDVTSLSSIDIDLDASTVTVGGGVTNGMLMHALQPVGKEASTSVCPCVGLLGATLGGGHGRLQGLHGLLSDNLLSVRLATAAGELITVSDTSHPDLFWGLRGAGHNFGVVTEAVYRIYDQTNEGEQFNADMTYDPVYIEEIFTALNEFDQQPETSIFVLFSIQPSLEPLVTLNFVSSAPLESASSQLDTALGHIPYITRNESMFPWSKLEDLSALGIGRTACSYHSRINPYAASLKHYDIPTMRNIFSNLIEFTTTYPDAVGSIVVTETYPVQGVQAIDDAATAYPLRKERFNVILSATYTDPALDEVGRAYAEGAAAALHETGGFEKPVVYLNYAQGTEGFGAMYGYEEWRRERLTGLKREWDPEGMFNAYHPIPTR